MKISDDFINRLKENVDIKDIIEQVAGITLKKEGSGFTAGCPIHGGTGNTPSFKVSTAKQTYHCFNCESGGNVYQFIMDHEKIRFPDAVKFLAGLTGNKVEYASNDLKTDSYRPATDLYRTNAATTFRYQEVLAQSPDALDYLKERGISQDIASTFKLGYAPRNNLITITTKKNKQHAIDLGLIKQHDKNDYDFFRHRVIFPIQEPSKGLIVGFGGRTLGIEKPKYLNSQESTIFKKENHLYGLYQAISANKQPDYIAVVEGYTDVLTCHQNNFTDCVSTMGTAITQNQLEQLFRYTDDIKLCFDGDRAGVKAAFRALEVVAPFIKDGKNVDFSILPDGLDPDDLIKQQGIKEFISRLDKAIPLSKMVIYSVKKDLPASISSQSKSFKLAEGVKHKLALFPNTLQRDILIRDIAEQLGIDQILLNDRLNALMKKNVNKELSHPIHSINNVAVKPKPSQKKKLVEKISL